MSARSRRACSGSRPLFDRDRAQPEVLRLVLREFPDLFAGIDDERILAAFLESDRVTVREYEADLLPEGLRLRRSRLFLGLLGLDDGAAEEIAAIYVRLYATVDAPVTGARRVVESLAASFPLGIVSNGFPDVQYGKLEALGIRERFRCVVLSEELGARKPHPAIFLRAAALLGRSPRECLYVGDSYEFDVVGAKGAGMRACWFNPTRRPPGPGDAPDSEIRALEDLLELLDPPPRADGRRTPDGRRDGGAHPGAGGGPRIMPVQCCNPCCEKELRGLA